MRKMIILGSFLLSTSIAFGAPSVTPTQTPAVYTAVNTLAKDVGNLQFFVNQMNTLYLNSWNYNILASTDTVSLTTTEQTSILNQYTTLKQNVVNDVNMLP